MWPDAPVTNTRMVMPSWQPDVSFCHQTTPRCQFLSSGYHRCMSRWEPDARGRLAQAALELYSERGYDQVTVAEIAQRAGLTERTFFRHYADKREVLSYGAALLQERLVRGVEEAPAGMAPVDVVGAALESAAEEVFGADGTFAARRQAVVAASPELLERELIKMAMFAVAVAAALRRRGGGEP